MYLQLKIYVRIGFLSSSVYANEILLSYETSLNLKFYDDAHL